MSQYINVTFLGTSSGGGPSESRNCSSLVIDMLGDGSLWMVDCAEGTVRQFSFQPRGAQGQMYLRSNRVTNVFITHMHADHTMGLITLIRNVLRAPPTTSDVQFAAPREPKRIDIYGPKGIRQFVRTIINVTHTRSHPEDFFVVHELLLRKEWVANHTVGEDVGTSTRAEGDIATGDVAGSEEDDETESNSEDESDDLWEEPSAPAEDGILSNELPGTDIKADQRHFWRRFLTVGAGGGEVAVDAGPIVHRDPCIGYIFTALPSQNPHPSAPLYHPRKLVILGDTSDPFHLVPLCVNPSPSLLVHEATDAFIPTSVDPQSRRSKELVQEKCMERGHSTPEMAGAFAKVIGAKKVALNHLGSRFPAPSINNNPRLRGAVLKEMERQASQEWGGGSVRAALDFTRITIPPERVPTTVDMLAPELMVLSSNGAGPSGAQNSSAGGGGEDSEAGGSHLRGGSVGNGRGRGRGEWDSHRGRGGRKREFDATSPGGLGNRSRSGGGGGGKTERSQSGHGGSRARTHKKVKESEEG